MQDLFSIAEVKYASLSLRKDRYNKKLKKYYVVYEENDTELSEDEEKHERKDVEAPCPSNPCW